jgi:hypothetical protein
MGKKCFYQIIFNIILQLRPLHRLKVKRQPTQILQVWGDLLHLVEQQRLTSLNHKVLHNNPNKQRRLTRLPYVGLAKKLCRKLLVE